MSQPQSLAGNPQAAREFLDRFDAFLIDCDGVIWSGEHVIPGIPETIEFLRSQGKRTIFVTNNSTRSRDENHKKLVKMGIPGDLEDMFGSSYSAAIYISRIMKLPEGKNKVFVIGEAGIEQELASEGIASLGGTDPAFRREFGPDDVRGIADGSALDPAVGVVLIGLDFHINYLKLAHAYQYIRRGAAFLATNTDSTFTMSHAFFPAAGSCSAPLITATKGQMPLILGKPSQAMMDAVEGKFQLNRARTCMVGDSLDTDIRFGIEGKLGGTLHVLSGVSKKEDWQKEDAPVVPAYYADSMSDLLSAKQ